MNAKYKVGDSVSVNGTITRIEKVNDNVLYYMDEAPKVPILEKNLSKRIDTTTYVELHPKFDEAVKTQINEYIDLLEKARSLADDLADAKVHLNFCFEDDRECCSAVLASVFTNSDND